MVRHVLTDAEVVTAEDAQCDALCKPDFHKHPDGSIVCFGCERMVTLVPSIRSQKSMNTNETQSAGSIDPGVMGAVVTENIRPPIPTKAFDWIAYRDGNEEGPRGFGRTEAEAINELLESEQ